VTAPPNSECVVIGPLSGRQYAAEGEKRAGGGGKRKRFLFYTAVLTLLQVREEHTGAEKRGKEKKESRRAS